MRLLAISDPAFIPEEAEIINSLFREGLVCMHIRKPESSALAYRTLLSGINPAFLGSISLHQHHGLAAGFGIHRLHFTEENRRSATEEKLGMLHGQGYVLSTSIHDLKETGTLPAVFDYTFFGPVFNSISKSGYKSVLPGDFFFNPEAKKIPVIGLGGIDSTNLKEIEKMNFDGAAVLGTLWEDPGKAVEVFIRLKALVSPDDPSIAN
jgi:thiamine-phosphate pyrophosphorylase